MPDISRDKRFLSRTGRHQLDSNPVAFLCVPVIQDEKVIATLGIDRKVVPGVQLDEDLKLLEIVGNLMADAVAVYHQEWEERESLLAENKRLREALTEGGNPGELIGNCRAMQNIYALIRQVAPSNATVLIRGSSGTGKELVAKAIRQLSPRADKPFVTLNCAALPENLVESSQPQDRARGGGGWRHSVSGRNRRSQPAGAGQASAIHSGTHVFTNRKQ